MKQNELILNITNKRVDQNIRYTIIIKTRTRSILSLMLIMNVNNVKKNNNS